MSATHCVITKGGTITDTSRHGVHVNSELVHQSSRQLVDKDIITFPGCAAYRFELLSTAPIFRKRQRKAARSLNSKS